MSVESMSPGKPLDLGIVELESILQGAPDIAPIVRTRLRALQAAREESWQRGLPALAGFSMDGSTPLLHAQTVTVDVDRLRRLLRELALDVTGASEPASRMHAAIRNGQVDPIDLTYAAITFDHERIERIAAGESIGAEMLAAIAHAASLPLLLACGNVAEPLLSSAEWRHSYCPVCGAWPLLAELRGLDREHWLRCGRCAAGWQFPMARCIYCDEQDHEQLSYLAGESEQESRRAVTCERCHGYLKTFSVLGPLSVGALMVRDLDSLELDVAALESEYGRPSATGYRLEIRLEAERTGSRWTWWRS